MECLSDELLFEAYTKAIKLKLNDEFIQLIKDEINNRNLTSIEYEQ